MINRNIYVQASAASSCNVAVTRPITFQKSFKADNIPTEWGEVKVSCTPGTVYQLGADSGKNSANGRRAMRCQNSDICGGNLIYYDLFKDGACTQLWGNQWDNWNSVIRSTAGANGEGYWPAAKVYSGQGSAPAGNYSDTVVVSVWLE